MHDLRWRTVRSTPSARSLGGSSDPWAETRNGGRSPLESRQRRTLPPWRASIGDSVDSRVGRISHAYDAPPVRGRDRPQRSPTKRLDDGCKLRTASAESNAILNCRAGAAGRSGAALYNRVPPLASITCPVVQRPSGPARKLTTPAMYSGRPMPASACICFNVSAPPGP